VIFSSLLRRREETKGTGAYAAQLKLSTEWFKYPADRVDDIDRKVQTTGHILEWLVASVDQPMLYHPRIVQATSFLARALPATPTGNGRSAPWATPCMP